MRRLAIVGSSQRRRRLTDRSVCVYKPGSSNGFRNQSPAEARRGGKDSLSVSVSFRSGACSSDADWILSGVNRVIIKQHSDNSSKTKTGLN